MRTRRAFNVFVEIMFLSLFAIPAIYWIVAAVENVIRLLSGN